MIQMSFYILCTADSHCNNVALSLDIYSMILNTFVHFYNCIHAFINWSLISWFYIGNMLCIVVSRNNYVRFCWFPLLLHSGCFVQRHQCQTSWVSEPTFCCTKPLWSKFLIILLLFYQIDCVLQYLICCHSHLNVY